MSAGKELKKLIPAALGLAVLILDSRTAVEGAQDGLELCLRTVVPSLFPFIFLSSLLTSTLLSGKLRTSRVLCRLFKIPYGADGILLTGLLGGYPVGAKCVAEALDRGQLSAADAERMLVFCNAAGPAFLFGITGSVFEMRWAPWCLWGIHLFSAWLVSRLIPSKPSTFIVAPTPVETNLPQRLRQSLRVMGEICGWIILMRVLISIFEKWFLWSIPNHWQTLICGILELSNGCTSSANINNTGLRFIFCSVMLGFGGLCVALQTSSVANGVKQALYIPGKIMQALISFLIAFVVQSIFFESTQKVALTWYFPAGGAFLFGILAYFIIKNKKSCGISETVGV